MATFTLDEGTTRPILVDFAPPSGLQETTGIIPTADNLAELSAKSLEAAMDTIRGMALRVSTLPGTLPAEFKQVEVEFGIKLDVQAGALIAQAGTEASLMVKLIWERKGTLHE